MHRRCIVVKSGCGMALRADLSYLSKLKACFAQLCARARALAVLIKDRRDTIADYEDTDLLNSSLS